MKRILVLILALALLPCAARAEMQYLSDPVYKQLNPDDPPPMQDMENLAKSGDVRAMYILGNLYAKGQGGLPRDEKLAESWFDQSAQLGYVQSFTRLAALAKRRKDMIAAYKWYSLAIEYTGGPWHDHAQAERDLITQDKKFTPDNVDQARKDINLWKSRARQAEQDARDREAAEKKKEEADENAKKEADAAQKKNPPQQETKKP